MSGYGYDADAYARPGYSPYGYGSSQYGYGGGYYSVRAGAYNAPYIYLSGPGSGGYYVEYSGTTKLINSAYENYYGGQSIYAATLKSNGDFIQASYNYQSDYRSESEVQTYISHAYLSANEYYGYYYSKSAASYQYVDVKTYTNGAFRYFNTISYSSESFFDGSFSSSYSDTVSAQYNGSTVSGSTHTYGASRYTDPSGYTTYHSGAH